MAPGASLYWNRCKGDAWADLFAVDLEDAHFDGMEGVFLAWHGGASPSPVLVGQGSIRNCLKAMRIDPRVFAFKGDGVFVSWARVDRDRRGGIVRYLFEATHPKIAFAPPPDPPVAVNLPGNSNPADAPPESTQPEQFFEKGARPSTPAPEAKPAPAAAEAPAPAKVKWISPLQNKFNAMIAERQKTLKASGGFFGGAKPKEDEALVLFVMQLILTEGFNAGASDIHVEPQQNYLRIRFRIDGILEPVLEIPNSLNISLVSHIRVACALDPEKSIGMGKPEDGRMGVTVSGKEADLRLSTFPTPYGDKAVLRIIPKSVNVPKLEELGLRPEAVAEVEALIHRPQGMIVVTGPTGSGKSTTLYTILQRLNEASRNIVTLEDPVEKKLAGIVQGMISPKVGFTFSEGLRAILRQDPNIIMVGEIRDTGTAEIALSASLTGHMLLTTLHTNSALGAITRLIDMKLEPFLIAAALTGVFAQRLARKICMNCRQEYVPTKAELAQIEEIAQRAEIAVPKGFGAKLFKGAGCPDCRDTGYQGRVLLLEYVVVTPAIRQLILKNAPLPELQKCALAGGAELLFHDALRKASDGLTTVEEVARVVGVEQ